MLLDPRGGVASYQAHPDDPMHLHKEVHKVTKA